VEKYLSEYTTYLPGHFKLRSGDEVLLTPEELRKNPFRLWIPEEYVEEVAETLLKKKFEEAKLSISKGELYSLRKKIDPPWEIHVRIFRDGLIESEVEVQREYLEHLGRKKVPVVYEVFEYYEDVYDKLHIIYLPRRDWIVEIENHYEVKISPPSTLTKWEPIVVTVLAMGIVGVLLYALSKLSEGKELEPEVRKD